MADDELHQLRDNFFIGNYGKAIEAGSMLHPSSDYTQAERDSLLYRAKLANGDASGIAALESASVPALKAIPLFAAASKGSKASLERLVALADETKDPTAKYLAASCLAAAENISEAVAVVSTNPTLEMRALRCQLLMMMDRLDLAEQQLQEMVATDDDAAVTKLANAWVSMGCGNQQEAFLTYCDLQALYGAGDAALEKQRSVPLIIAKAVSNMGRKQWQEAMEDLQRALKQWPENPDVLANIVACCHHLKKHAEAEEHAKTLFRVAPLHPLVLKQTQLQQAVKRFVVSA